MISIDDLRIFLPKYLSPESEKWLCECLQQFPSNINEVLYTTHLRDHDTLFQGDGLNDFLVIALPDESIHKTSICVISNTCDVDPHNKRLLPANIVYTPIVNFKKYADLLYSKLPSEKVDNHLGSIKRQEPTNIFYLPKTESIDESIIFFDKVVSCAGSYFSDYAIPQNRLFTLSDYGFYLFVFKLSVHFTRINEKIDRRVGVVNPG